MKLKVCGMRESQNIKELVSLKPDFIGFIFYEKSPRYVENTPVLQTGDAQRVGVFVNPTADMVRQKAVEFDLDLIQLHGSESVEFVQRLQQEGHAIIKVFSVLDKLPLDDMKPYEPYVEYFLFDTKTPAYGGSGQRFDWTILQGYDLDKPFFLSGGIDLEDLDAVRALTLPQLYAIDVNSRFEMSPGLKDIGKIKELKNRMV